VAKIKPGQRINKGKKKIHVVPVKGINGSCTKAPETVGVSNL
jgi:hypothetical protein